MHDAGFQIATHSNGDREIDMALTAIERPPHRTRQRHEPVAAGPRQEGRRGPGGAYATFEEHGGELESACVRCLSAERRPRITPVGPGP